MASKSFHALVIGAALLVGWPPVSLSAQEARGRSATHPKHASGVRTYQGYPRLYNSYGQYPGSYSSYGGHRSGGLNGTADGPTDLVGGDTKGP